jgi:hypothetical protein
VSLADETPPATGVRVPFGESVAPIDSLNAGLPPARDLDDEIYIYGQRQLDDPHYDIERHEALIKQRDGCPGSYSATVATGSPNEAVDQDESRCHQAHIDYGIRRAVS